MLRFVRKDHGSLFGSIGSYHLYTASLTYANILNQSLTALMLDTISEENVEVTFLRMALTFEISTVKWREKIKKIKMKYKKCF